MSINQKDSSQTYLWRIDHHRATLKRYLRDPSKGSKTWLNLWVARISSRTACTCLVSNLILRWTMSCPFRPVLKDVRLKHHYKIKSGRISVASHLSVLRQWPNRDRLKRMRRPRSCRGIEKSHGTTWLASKLPLKKICMLLKLRIGSHQSRCSLRIQICKVTLNKVRVRLVFIRPICSKKQLSYPCMTSKSKVQVVMVKAGKQATCRLSTLKA